MKLLDIICQFFRIKGIDILISLLGSAVATIILSFMINTPYIGIVQCILVIAIVVIIVFCILLYGCRFDTDKLKIGETLLFTTVYYLYESTHSLTSNYNNLDLESVSIRYILDEPIVDANNNHRYKESFYWHMNGISTSVGTIQEITLHVTSPLSTGLHVPNLEYYFSVAGSEKKRVYPEDVTKPIIGLLRGSMEGTHLISMHNPFEYEFIREKISDKYDMRGYFYLIDPKNYSLRTRLINVSIEGRNDIYRNANVTIYKINRDTFNNEVWCQCRFENVIDNNGNRVMYRCKFMIPEKEIKGDCAYGYIIEK